MKQVPQLEQKNSKTELVLDKSVSDKHLSSEEKMIKLIHKAYAKAGMSVPPNLESMTLEELNNIYHRICFLDR